MMNHMVYSKAAGMLRKEYPATSGRGIKATNATGALQVGVAAYGVVSMNMRNDL